MAMTKCKECGGEVSTKADSCPKCGAKVKRTGCLTMTVGALFAVVAVSTVVGSCEKSEREAEQASRAAAASAAEQKAKEAEKARLAAMSPEDRAAEQKRLEDEAAKQKQAREADLKETEERLKRSQGLLWNYQTNQDDLTGKPVETAWVLSTNQVEFGFPYQGPQHAKLTLRKHPKYGTDAILQIERGQFLCGVSDCTVSVRFDDGPVQEFGVVESADNNSTVLFFSNYSRFLQKALKSKRAYVSAVVYQEGNPTFEFNIEGLDWK